MDGASAWILAADESLQAGGLEQAEPGSPAGWLATLANVIESRQGADPSRSYVARLLAAGDNQILKKVGEEATELVMAAKDGDRDRLVAEAADLWFHSLVALAHYGLRPEDVVAELMRREGVSGIDEKAARSATIPAA